MPTNYVLLEKITVGAVDASSVTFSSIPQTGYTDLIVRASLRNTATAVGRAVNFSFNSNTSNRSSKVVYTNGSVPGAANYTNNIWLLDGTNAALASANTFSNFEAHIPSYNSSNNKSISIDSVTENNATFAQSGITSGLWANTSAITSITLTPEGGLFTQGSTFYLYGVAALGTTPLISPYATGGDIIDTDGTYWYHTFRSSGTFTPVKAITCDYLVVAGGGGGGKGANSGGGGAGGLRSTVTATGGGGSLESALSLASGTGYTVTIGAGGAGGASDGTNGTDGSNSVFSTITSTGGGGGGASGSNNGRTGGSGGGGGLYETIGGTGTANQGYAGGPNIGLAGDATKFRAGGGGGAGAVGGGAAASVGTGGAGVATSISGSSVTYAGGGGGGANDGIAAGGAGGGGAAGSAGTANTGGGGGGAGNSGGNNVSAGGSGIVIVRYLV
jgi:hypothetical protein